ncbi:MAG: serine hydrolase domain-containing protein [bacterium]
MKILNIKAFFKASFLLAICIAFIQLACKMDINQPVEAPKSSWDASLNTHPRGDAFQKVLDDYVKRGLPGVVLFVKSPQGMWNGAAGYAKIETKEPMTPVNLHYSDSMAKTYTATAIMMLVEEGKIELDEKINQYLPRNICDNIGNGNEATVRQLLNHTSGIKDHWEDITFLLDVFNDPFRPIPPEKLLEYIYGESPYFPAGQGTEYSNTNFLLLAMIMDRVLGESHAKFISERIIRRLGLENTYYKNEPAYPKPPGLVNSYAYFLGNEKLENWSEGQNAVTAGILVGHAGFIASSYDYARFLEALFNEELVGQALLNDMTEGFENGWAYGLGLEFCETGCGKAMGHTGDSLASQSKMLYYPKTNTYIVLLTNVGFFGKMEDLFDELFVAAEDAIFD